MASNEKPRFSLTARRKDAPKGSKDRIKIGGGYAGKFPGSFNMSMRDVESITLKNGEVITTADHWFDLKDWEDSGGSRRPSGTPDPGISGGGHGANDDVPFRAQPRMPKDIA